jgi:hypothetical protein
VLVLPFPTIDESLEITGPLIIGSPFDRVGSRFIPLVDIVQAEGWSGQSPEWVME